MKRNNNVLRFPGAARDDSPGRRLIPARLREARLAARLNQSELARAVGVKRQSISYYEKGDRTPEPKVMAAIAETLRQPISYFMTEPAPSFGNRSANFFRKVGVDTKRRNAACAIYADWFAQTAYAFEPYANFPEVILPSFEPANAESSLYEDDEIENIAEQVRQHFGLGWGPISNVVRLLETSGVVVSRVEIPGEKIEAFSYWSGNRPFVFLASDKGSAARSRFDACHELAHLVLHRWVDQEDIDDKQRLKEIESEADRFSGAFLLPRKSFPNEVYSPRAGAFIDLKKRWKVSIQAMIYRCKTLGIFDEQQIVNLYKQVSNKKWKTREPLDGPGGLELEQPLLLRRIAELVVLEHKKLNKSELKTSLSFSPRVIEQLASLPAGTLKEEPVDAFAPTLK